MFKRNGKETSGDNRKIQGYPRSADSGAPRGSGVYGYLPLEVQLKISEGLNIPLAEVYGVVSFYTQFTTNPKGKYRVSVCMGTACYVKGSQEILDKFKEKLGIDVGECTEDGLFSLDACRCIGACGLAPVVTVNDDVYGKLNADMVEDILKKYEEEAGQ